MTKAKNSRNLVTMVLAGVLIVTAALALDGCAKKPPGDGLLRLVPAESLFCVRLNNFDYTLNTLDQYLAGASPVPMGLSMMARAKLAELLGSPDLQGVKTTGNFAVFAQVSPGESSQPTAKDIFITAAIPLSDYKEFIEGNPNVGEPDAKGISTVSGPGIPEMVAKRTGNYVLLTRDYDKLLAVAKSISAKSPSLAAALDEDMTHQALNEPVWAHGNIELVHETFGQAITAQLEKMKKMISQAQAMGTAQPIDPSAIIDVYITVLEALLDQTRSLTITLNPEPTVLTIRETIAAVPGTEMANMFTAGQDPVKENKLLGHLQDGAAMNLASRINAPLWRSLNAKSIDLMAALAGESITAEETAKWRKLAEDAMDSLAGPAAFYFSVDPQTTPPFAAGYVLEVADVDKFNTVIEESSALMSTGTIFDFYKKLGLETSFEIKRAAETYKGVSIDSANLTMKSTDPNSPQGQMIKRMYGGGFNYRWAVVDSLWVCAVGGDPDAAIRELIDQAKAGGPKEIPSEIKTAVKLLADADKADFMATFNYVRMFKMLPAMAPIPISVPDIPTKSNLVFAGSAADNKMVIDIALPKEHLTEIVSAFAAMQQQMMQQQQIPKKP